MKKLISLILVVAFIFCFSFTAYAEAITLTVTGATVMTMALLGTLGIISINCAGFSDALANAAIRAGMGVKEFGQQMMASYARSQNITAGQAVQLAAQGTSYLENGAIVFDNAVSNFMSGFVKWAWSKDGGNLIADAVPTGGNMELTNNEIASLVSIPMPFGKSWHGSIDWTAVNGTPRTSEYYFEVYGENSGITAYINGKNFNFLIASSENYYFDGTNNVQMTNTYTQDGKTIYYAWFGSYLSRVVKINDYSFVCNRLDTSSQTWPRVVGWYMCYGDSVVGNPEYDNVDTNVFDPLIEGEDVINVINPDNYWSIPDTNVTGGVVDVDAWLEALADLTTVGTASIPMTIDEVLTDVLVETAEGADVMEVDIADSIPVGADVVADSTSVSGLDDYTLDLTDFFPFCIPFDIYALLSLFAANREAPVVNWRFYVPNICDETITLDFSRFDAAAAVLRRVELIAACIGLALMTKKLIQGGD